MPEQLEHIVIGAGISGLGLAHRAARKGVETLVLEGADRVGGCMCSQRFPDCGDFWAEAGSHSCFNSYGHLIDILQDLDLLGRVTPKGKVRFALWQGDRRKSILSALHPFEALVSVPRIFFAAKSGKGVADYYATVLGSKNYRDLFRPAFRSVICQDPDDFPADLLFRRKPRRKEVARSFTLPGGLSDIPRAIAGQEGLEVRTGREASAVHRDGSGFRVALAGGEELACRYLTLAVPPDVAAGLLPAELDDVRSLVSGIQVARVETLVFCIGADHLAHLPPLAGLIAVDDDFYSMVSRDFLPDPDRRGFAFHFRPGALEADGQLERACRALGVRAEQIAGRAWVTHKLPALRTGHQRLVADIDARLAGTRLAITGNWFLGVSIEDCLTRSHSEYERLFGS